MSLLWFQGADTEASGRRSCEETSCQIPQDMRSDPDTLPVTAEYFPHT